MSEPEYRRDTEDGKGKFYDHPLRTDENGQPRRYISVTTTLQVKEKDGLKWWAAKLAARRAMENLPKLLRAARIDPCGRSWHRDDSRCNECAVCVQRWVELYHCGESSRRAREGSAMHRVIDWWSKTGNIHYVREKEDDPTTDELKPYIERFLEWVKDYGLAPQSWRMCETTVYNHTYGYAGTLDAHLLVEPITSKAAKFCARIHHSNGRTDVDAPVLLTLDAKTREGDGKAFFDEHALQLAPYRHAETALPRGAAMEFELPRTDAGAIFQPRPDGYTFEPVVTDQRVMDTFLSLLAAYRTISEVGASWTRIDSFQVPPGWKWTPPGVAALARTTKPVTELPPVDVDQEIADAKAGTPVGKKAPRKRAPAKKAAGKPLTRTESMLGTVSLDAVTRTGAPRPAGRTEWTDENIPF